MFNKNQLASLNQELDSSRIKTREKGNVSLSYIEGFDVIDTANLIFGYGNWSYLISKLEQVSQEQNHNQNFVVCYKAVVKLIIKDENHSKSISRQDVGFGSGVAKTLNDAHENAGKEAVTDGLLKRAMRSFGNQFGNSLYDKSRNHVNQDNSYQTNQNQNYNQNQQRPPQNNQQQQQPYQNENVNNRATNSNFKGVGNQQQTARQQNQAQNQTMQQQVQNSNSRNVNQNPNNQQNNPPQQHSFQNNQSFEYQSLFNLGLDVIEQNGFLIVTGDNQYSYRDAIKACSFRFDSKSKTWYKPIESAA